ncbi:MAG: outer membrane lipoprotein carrier protein LolA [Leptospiraceae bacterium]|nr:outer membrane lipoprotein carrier protein LolA [Leptospiraceae bacterium]NUM40366.1 outer membrane lipoprotein carrier protein LolA [Leptospiraceae bacterium]
MNSFETIRANVTINGTLSGVLSYKRPNQMHIKLSDGRVISANGRVLWIYSPASAVAGKQDLKGTGGGISSLLSGYEDVLSTGKVFRLKSSTKAYEEIIVSVGPNNILKAIRLKPQGKTDYTDISFSAVQTNVGLASNLFNFHPPANAQIVENPFNQRQ